jgi:hypothetical protein
MTIVVICLGRRAPYGAPPWPGILKEPVVCAPTTFFAHVMRLGPGTATIMVAAGSALGLGFRRFGVLRRMRHDGFRAALVVMRIRFLARGSLRHHWRCQELECDCCCERRSNSHCPVSIRCDGVT